MSEESTTAAAGGGGGEEKEKEKAVPADKVVVLFKAVGNAPALKLKKFQVSREATVQTVVDFLRKQLKYTPVDPLPPPDRQLGMLARCFEANGKIVFHYATTQAWG